MSVRTNPEDAHNAMENAVSHHLGLNDFQLSIVDRALTDLETQLLPSPAPEPTRADEADQAAVLAPSRQSFARSGLASLDPVRKRLQRLQRLAQRARDAEMILVNNALNLKVYALPSANTTCLATDEADALEPDSTQLVPA